MSRFPASRYVQPLREGGSLPAVVDTEHGGLFVVKFRGAGQGAKVLVAELVVGLIARALDLPVPELALVDVSERFGRSEPDPEIQELLRRSHGTNVGMRYLEGAFNFDWSAAGHLISPELAARIVWLDAFTTNPDRTAHNPNLLIWQRQPWIIDHGAALYAHHDWASVDDARTLTSFPLIRSHILLAASGDLAAADERSAAALTSGVIETVLGAVPDDLLLDAAGGRAEFASADEARERYVRYLTRRLQSPRAFAAEAISAQAQVRREPPLHLSARR
ncbi:MAG TPA: HipA family kinase [Gemmatimonadaceae bacterium]|nr:HipA family kinase [Gemmatimonadaceae bacterium]